MMPAVKSVRVRYAQRRNLGNYEHAEAEIVQEIHVDEDEVITEEDIANALRKSKELVWRGLRQRSDS